VAADIEKRVLDSPYENDPDASKRSARVGYVTEVKHPSEPRDTAVDKRVADERAVREAQVRQAKQGQEQPKRDTDKPGPEEQPPTPDRVPRARAKE
jgi:hypothetical protein